MFAESARLGIIKKADKPRFENITKHLVGKTKMSITSEVELYMLLKIYVTKQSLFCLQGEGTSSGKTAKSKTETIDNLSYMMGSVDVANEKMQNITDLLELVSDDEESN